MRALLREHFGYYCDKTERHHECGLDVTLWANETTKTVHYRLKNDKGVIEWVYNPDANRVKTSIKDGDITNHLTFALALLVGMLIRLRVGHVVH